MRHVRILGLCLAAVFAVSAVAAMPALAEKDPYSTATWQQYKYCPFAALQELKEEGHQAFCFYGRTSGGSTGGFFTLGNATVKLNKPIVLQGGYYGVLENGAQSTEEEEAPYEGKKIVGAGNGGQTLESPELPVDKGLGLITPTIEKRAEWPEALKQSFREAKQNKETALNVKIEVAGNGLYETWGALNLTNLLEEKGNLFELPLKVRMINPWLERLGGGSCEVGSETAPIIQDLTAEAPGRAEEYGGFKEGEGFSQVEVKGSRLVDLNWTVPTEGDANGCGGEYGSYLDAALNYAMELPYQHGETVLEGDLFSSETGIAQRKVEEEG